MNEDLAASPRDGAEKKDIGPPEAIEYGEAQPYELRMRANRSNDPEAKSKNMWAVITLLRKYGHCEIRTIGKEAFMTAAISIIDARAEIIKSGRDITATPAYGERIRFGDGKEKRSMKFFVEAAE